VIAQELRECIDGFSAKVAIGAPARQVVIKLDEILLQLADFNTPVAAFTIDIVRSAGATLKPLVTDDDAFYARFMRQRCSEMQPRSLGYVKGADPGRARGHAEHPEGPYPQIHDLAEPARKIPES
jgi:hypothetical protein